MKLYRIMRVDADGKPLVGDEGMMLGVRPSDPARSNKARDVPAVVSDDPVGPGAGLSCYTDPAAIKLRRTSLVRLWSIDTGQLPARLTGREAGTPHWHIEPTAEMTLSQYQQILAVTRDLWQLEPEQTT